MTRLTTHHPVCSGWRRGTANIARTLRVIFTTLPTPTVPGLSVLPPTLRLSMRRAVKSLPTWSAKSATGTLLASYSTRLARSSRRKSETLW